MLSHSEIIDLTHDLSEEVPTWTGECGFRSQVDHDYAEVGCRVMSYQLIAGVGTHMDAPLHFCEEGKDIASIPVSELVAPLCVLRVASIENPDIFISPEDVLQYEERFGKIPSGSMVAADTGWSRHWSDPKKFRSEQMRYPGYSIEAAELLMERGIVGLGIDTLSPDGSNMEFPVHHLLLPNGKYIIENMANLDKVPQSGAWVIALPPKIKQGAESPCRCIALIPPKSA